MSTIYQQTPLFQGKGQNAHIHYKMDCFQPSGSFKLRGMDYAVRKYLEQGTQAFVASSGGNAGYSLAYVCHRLNVPLQVVVPETTGQRMVELIKGLGAEVTVKGSVWDESHAYALSLVGENKTYMSPFDDPYLWTGHATMIDEVAALIDEPDYVAVAVGGGGLLCGVMEGIERNGWEDTTVVACETEGAASFQTSLLAGSLKEIPTINTVATSLGARKIAKEAFNWTSKRNIVSHVVSDFFAVKASIDFAENYHAITEPACGAALSFAEKVDAGQTVLIIACGGVGYDADGFSALKGKFNL